MYAVLIINVEAALESTFHYHVPADLESKLQIGHLVEVEFGRRLAQGIVVALDQEAPVADTKPIIGLIDEQPVVRPGQITLAEWLSRQYLTPINACLRLMLPPGLTRWADITLELNRYWDGNGRLTETQEKLVNLLREKGDRRGRQITRALPKTEWKTAANQLVRRGVLTRGSILDSPKARPKVIRTAELIAGPQRIQVAAGQLGRSSKQAAIIAYLLASRDPLPAADIVLAATGAQAKHLRELVDKGLIQHTAATTLVVPTAHGRSAAAVARPEILAQLPLPRAEIAAESLDTLLALNLVRLLDEPAEIGLAVSPREALNHLFRLRKAEKYQAVLNLLAKAATAVELKQIYSETGATLQQLKQLANLDLIRFGAEEVWRDPLADRDFVPADPPRLTPDQARVWGRIKIAMIELGSEAEEAEAQGSSDAGESENASSSTINNSQLTIHNSPLPFLLHGVTGSGKTEIYMRAIDFALQRGQRAIVLVPEIALTPQTVRRFAARFPGRVAVLHSRLTAGERYDTWRRARQGLFDIVVGPRSALFAPLDDLGVIVVDEEHDHSYKQGPPIPAPYYHACDVAIELGRITGAVVILGSATPDLVTYHGARAGRLRLLELPRRIMGHRQRIDAQAERLQVNSRYQQTGDDPDDAVTIPLPPIQIVDLRQELRAGNRSIFSRSLQQAMSETLDRREQVILFLNRRGTATFVICRDCGHVLKCPRCDMPLTYHRPGAALVCHHCGRKEKQPDQCPQCGSSRIRYFGLGTEEVENLVQRQWPQARIVRWDRDTTAGRDAHELLLASFINQEADILVGTQMIAKGLDLPLVTLVGVISADVSLGLPDYRTGERTFQLLAQVAGRAGRGLLGGRVIIQTYQPDHYAIQAAAEHDYTTFYLEEIRFRTQHSLPPFRRLARLLLIDPIDERAQRQAEELARNLRRHAREKALGATEILGPTPPFFNRIDGRYRWQIIVRSPDPNRLLADFTIPAPWIIDIDPVSTL
jgi:primosomal protein N' (replication factor Y) (superfamily II helicase)